MQHFISYVIPFVGTRHIYIRRRLGNFFSEGYVRRHLLDRFTQIAADQFERFDFVLRAGQVFPPRVDGNASILEGLNETLVLLSEPRNYEAWRRDLYLHGLKYTCWFAVMEFSQLTMAQLQYSGGMRLITEMQVREAMVAYEQKRLLKPFLR